VDDLVLLAWVSVSLRREGSGRARATWTADAHPLPIGEPDPTARLRRIAAESRQRKRIPRPQLFSGILAVAAVQKAITRMAKRRRRVNIYVANVPGPPVSLYPAGAPLREVFAVVPSWATWASESACCPTPDNSLARRCRGVPPHHGGQLTDDGERYLPAPHVSVDLPQGQ